MNTSALKSFAPAVRRQLMEAVGRKLDVVLAAQTPDYRTTYEAQVAELRKLAQDDRQGLIERVAYTWFNRLAALRYLDARGWHPFRARVLTPATPAETQPELLRLMRTGALPEELQRYTDVGRLNDLLDSRIPSADPQSEVYRHLVLAACRFYHSLLPDLFERLDDETELLLPDDLLTEHSVVQGFRTEISDEDCAEVEVLGWLYQFYISEKKDAVMARKSAVPSEDIPAVTQLFTPHWIVRYLVENSLGRLWLLNRPASGLREQMPYYIEGKAETDFLKITRPEEIRLIDPAVGSGHMLTYAFDLLYAIYEEEGYAPSEIPGLILRHNLYGVDIDPRAAQLASLALVLKARERSRRFLQREQLVKPNVIALRDVRFEERELREFVRALDLGELFNQPLLDQLHLFEEATTFGSLIKPVLGEREIQQLRQQIEAKELGSELFLSGTHQKVLRVLVQAEYLTQHYHVVVTNPPYMGTKGMNASLKSFVGKNYPEAKTDLMTCFMDRGLSLLYRGGMEAMVNLPSWLFLSSFEDLRRLLLKRTTVRGLLHLGRGVFGSDFGSVAFVLANRSSEGDYAVYRRLFERQSDVASIDKIEELFFQPEYGKFTVQQEEFHHLSGCPIAYWISPRMREALRSENLGDVADARIGMATGKNENYIRYWFEVQTSNIGFGCSSRAEAKASRRRWFPYAKGGEFRKWYGNLESVVDWEDDGHRLQTTKHPSGSRIWAHNFNLDRIFKPAICWTAVTIADTGFRYHRSGFLFDAAAALCQPKNERDMWLVLGALNSNVAKAALRILNPTVNLAPGYLSKVPVPHRARQAVEPIVMECVSLAEADWNASEISWDFARLPLLQADLKGPTLRESWREWEIACSEAIQRMQELETECNRVLIDAYGLQDELSPDVSAEEITLIRADRRQDMAAFLSYAVGCMMGRYSLDAPGLILADAGATMENYLAKVGKTLEELTFTADQDGIIPVLDGEWFEDDIVARTREFLRATFGEATLRENIRFIEESLGKDLRKYFLTDFYKDHLQTYNKRPIYWMVQSPKKGFSLLIYLHRYTRDTMNLVLNRYLREYQAKLRDRLAHLARVQASESLSARDRTAAGKEADRLTKVLHECEEWERQTVLPLAQERIELDLDDGVKVNYAKLGEALAPVPGLS